MRFRVIIPASTSNLGSGFDTLSAALGLYLTVEALPSTEPGLHWEWDWDTRNENILEQSIKESAGQLGISIPPLTLHVDNPIPLQRGLGSSGAAIIAGIKIVERVGELSLTSGQVMELALPLEGHPDNLAASLHGGWVISCTDGDRVLCRQVEAALECSFVVAVPDLQISTRRAREILPQKHTRQDAIFNMQRCALLVHALHSGEREILREATRDRIHQPYRSELVPGLADLLAYRDLPPDLEDSVLAVFLSGSGSSVAALISDRPREVQAWMQARFARSGLEVRFLNLKLDRGGARTIEV